MKKKMSGKVNGFIKQYRLSVNNSINKTTNTGFTLIEVLIATMIFTTIMILASMLFGNIIQTNYKLKVQRQVNEEANNALETITREAKLALGRNNQNPILIEPSSNKLILTEAPKLVKDFDWTDRDGDGNKDSIKVTTNNYDVVTNTEESADKRDIILVLDISGSMTHCGDDNVPCGKTKLEYLKKNAIKFINLMNNTYDQVGVVTYSNTATLNSELTTNFTNLKNIINAITHDGCTNIYMGIKKANTELDSIRHRADAKKIVVLLSDGWANTTTDPDIPDPKHDGPCKAGRIARQKAIDESTKGWDDSITYFSIGLGATGHVDELTLQKIAKDINDPDINRYFHSPSGEELEDTFKSIAEAIKSTTYPPTTSNESFLTSENINISNLQFKLYDTLTQPFLEIEITIRSKGYDSSPAWKRASSTIKTTISLRNYK